ncbi:MAG TPA: hypothetical protein VFS05_03105, partial [Gemmatimonadaceae bacterium]|nr:hypothetical protein [Gemmatimonadaceae bacterium]
AAAGSLIGAIGSIVGGLHNLIGGGVDAADVQAEQELKRAMRENAEAVERLRLELERSAFGIDEQRRVGEGAAQAAAFNPNLQQPLAEPLQRAVLETTLQHFGVSLAEVERMAREYSIALFENGQYVVGSLEAVAAAAGASVENLTKFGDTLDGWARRLDVHAQIFDIDGPQQALDDAVKMLVQFSPAARAAFQGIDTTTEQGRAALEEAMRAFLTALENETIPVELFGLSIDQITQLLLDADGAMDELAQGARDAAGALTNVPPVFKLAQRRFEAMMEEALLPPSFTTPSLPPMQIPPPDLTPQPIEWGELTASNARLADVMDTGTRRLADVLGQLIPLAPVSTVVSGGSALHAAERAAQPIIVNHTYHVAGAQIPAAELDRMSARELLQRMTEQARTQARSQGGDTTYPFTRLL